MFCHGTCSKPTPTVHPLLQSVNSETSFVVKFTARAFTLTPAQPALAYSGRGRRSVAIRRRGYRPIGRDGGACDLGDQCGTGEPELLHESISPTRLSVGDHILQSAPVPVAVRPHLARKRRAPVRRSWA